MSAARPDRRLLALALAVFAALGLAMSRSVMVFSEEFIIVPTTPGRVIAADPNPDGSLRDTPACGRGSPMVVLSTERPTLALCVGARRYPIMAAPHFTGLYLWPMELLRWAHGDDPFALRAMLLCLGALSLWLTARLVADLGGARLGAMAALGMATSSCFVCLSAIVQCFETLPWLWLVLALRRVIDARGGDPGPRYTAAAACVGLALLANVKAVFLVAPFALLAWRLGARPPAMPLDRWRRMATAAALPLIPVALPVAMDPSMRWSQGRGSDVSNDLASNLARPAKALEAARDLVLEAADFGRYITRGPWDPLPTLAAAAVCAFVLVDTARTLARRRGCVVTAACGVAMLTYLAVVTLLYAEFPANYTPLHAVFGVAVGCAADRLYGSLRAPRPLRVALVAGVFAVFALGTANAITAFAETAFVTNSRAERELARHLAAHPEPGVTTVTVNLLAGGVVDAVSRGRVRTVQAHPWLGACERGTRRDEAPACLRARWTSLLRGVSGPRGARVVMPASLAFVGRAPWLLAAQRAALDDAARDLGMTVELERAFTTPAGAPAASLLRVARPR